jgi:hypothetical protein
VQHPYVSLPSAVPQWDTANPARTFSFGDAEAGSGCDARRFPTGRSIRAWRTLCGRQMTRNAGLRASPLRPLRRVAPRASASRKPWLGGILAARMA